MNHQVIITLGSNHQAEHYLPQVLESLHSLLSEMKVTPAMQTVPIDFPYPSSLFTNYVIWAETDRSEEEIRAILHLLEEHCGRTLASRQQTPQVVTADIDLIIWDGEIRKPNDLLRPYLIDGLHWLNYRL